MPLYIEKKLMVTSTDRPTNRQGEYRAICLFESQKIEKKAENCNNGYHNQLLQGGTLIITQPSKVVLPSKILHASNCRDQFRKEVVDSNQEFPNNHATKSTWGSWSYISPGLIKPMLWLQLIPVRSIPTIKPTDLTVRQPMQWDHHLLWLWLRYVLGHPYQATSSYINP